ncbi:hypothetical protein N9N28_03280 [Rubripirellula amarantea]|uniref:Uncharacterized protein n=1 Tax=Rubripirellula amarantea TaxID=2527999 RepID=A0A5C5WQ75_9BACT|nr:hypothetical protein [Rubripirellula amarantea]MDA8743636.1 hypothetical protein [Rubripirellula amarantea]TWT52415.1 hypothetical protein Pla22_00390 [Rubripirellula amarantea]
MSKFPRPRSIAKLAFALNVGIWLHGINAPLVHASDVVVGESGSQPCVLLGNGNVVFGAAHQVGEYVVIRKGGGSEVRLPRTAVACWAGSVRNLYQYRIDHRETKNVRTHLEEADWCLRYELFDLAENELELARKLDPSHPDLSRLELRLNLATSEVTRSVPVISGIEHAQHDQEISPPSAISQVSVEQFARTVQSTLATRCSRCHEPDSGRKWTLASPPGKSRASSETTHANLNAVLGYVNADDYRDSELLIKAITPHGGEAAPLGLRHRKAIVALEYWLQRAAYEMKHSGQEVSTTSHTQPSDAFDRDERLDRDDSIADPTWSESFEDQAAIDAEFETAKRPVLEADQNSDLPWRMPQVDNPFDPDLFNRQHGLR